jgi:hypothetical protein
MIQDGRRPGSLGVISRGVPAGLLGNGRLPAVFGIGPGIVVAQSVVGAVTTKLPMPRPFGSLDQKDVNTYDNKDRLRSRILTSSWSTRSRSVA